MRFNLQMSSTAMKLLPLLCLCLLTRSGTTFAFEQGPVIIVQEGSDVMLPCSLSSKENIEYKRFEWKKGEHLQVFMYDAGTHSNNGLSGQAQQFKGRVSHFQDELKNGNAVIIIRNTKVTDSGYYTCDFPQPSQTFNIQLVVVGPGAIKVKQDSDVILPCSLSSKQDITSDVFDWKKDDQKDIFLYNGKTTSQDQQFNGRVSHFQEELTSGNASIKIRDTKVTDSGVYTCIFPKLQPRQTFPVQLFVGHVLKDRSGENIAGASAKPSVKTIKTNDGALLQCDVRGASPKPTVEWRDSAGNKLPAEEPQVSERGGSYDITLNITVTRADNYHCVATQEEIGHQIDADTYVPLNGFPTGWVVGGVVGVLIVVLVVVLGIKFCRKRGPRGVV